MELLQPRDSSQPDGEIESQKPSVERYPMGPESKIYEAQEMRRRDPEAQGLSIYMLKATRGSAGVAMPPARR